MPMPTVREWMSTPPLTITADTTLDEAYKIMAIRDIRHLPVVENGRLVGLLFLDELMRAKLATQINGEPQPPAGQIMGKAVTIGPDEPIGHVTVKLLRHKISALAVVEEEDKLVGLITETDIFRLVMMRALKVPENQEIELRSGEKLLLRPARPDDLGRVHAFYDGLSEKSRYFRFLSQKRTWRLRDLRQLVTFDYQTQISFVASKQQHGAEMIVGMVDYVPLDEKTPHLVEFAIAVADDYQRGGLGTMMFQHLVHYAREHGVEQFIGVVHDENEGMARLIQRLHLRTEVSHSGSVREFTIFLNEPMP
jgi:CBS domain-containing protein/RimJ/RimL family protein N-acetyltransferase